MNLKNINSKYKKITLILCIFLFATIFFFSKMSLNDNKEINKNFLFKSILNSIILSDEENNALAEGKKISLNVNDTITYYEDLKTAISNTPDNEEVTIKLLTNIEFNREISIPENKKIIIDGNSNKITRYKDENEVWYTNRLFNIKAKGELTLKNIIIDEENIWNFNKEKYNKALLNSIQTTDIHAFVTPQKNSPDVKGWTINNNGTLNIINSTIKNHYSSSGIGVIYGPTGSKVILKDTTITHCASTGSGVVASITGKNTTLNVEKGTIIDGNYAGGNGGIFKIYNGANVTMNDGAITNTTSLNTNGVVAMTYGVGSTFILNGGTLSKNSGVQGKNNIRNSPIYAHAGSKFIMNDGVIENNFGLLTGGVDIAGNSNADIELNGGIIQNNETPNKNSYRNNLYVGNDYNLIFGENMKINGNVYIAGSLTNDGTVNGDVTLELDNNTNPMSISGNGAINGNLIVYYNDEKPVMDENIVVSGDLVSCHNPTQVVVTLEYNGGVDENGKNVRLIAIDTNAIPDLPKPTLTGHSLTWYKDKELTTQWTTSPISNKTTLYAGWKINKYNAIWNIDGQITTESITYGEVIKKPTNPTKTGYTFDKWTNYKENMTMPDKDVTFIATWNVNEYTITFNTNGGKVMEPITQNYGEDIEVLTIPTKEGHTFIGWNEYIENMTMPDTDLTFTANWKVNQYTISFDTNGGSSIQPITKNFGEIINLPEPPTKTGHEFSGWFGYKDGMTMPSENLKFTAIWAPKKYTITFNTNGGTKIKSIIQEYGTKMMKPTDPTYKCKKLVGWYSDKELTIPYEFNSYVTNDITLYAKWEDDHKCKE